MQNRKLCYFIGLLLCLHHCKPRSPSDLKILNANSSGYIIKFNGTIDLTTPSNDLLAKLLIWNDLKPSTHGSETGELSKELIAESVQMVKDDFPKLKTELELKNPMKWILTQLQYPIYFGKQRNSLSVNPFNIEISQPDPQKPIYSYSVEADLSPSPSFNQETFKNMALYLPLNPITILFDTNEINNEIDFNSFLKKDITRPCFSPDGHLPAPKNYYHFLNPYDHKECLSKYSDKFVEIKQFELVSRNESQTFPEYHLLLQDNLLEVLVMFGSSSDEWGLKNFNTTLNYLRSSGFKLTKQQKANDYLAEKKMLSSGQTFAIKVRLFHEESSFTLTEKFIAQNLINYEIIINSGHAGYGYNLFRMFNTYITWPKNKYQLIFLYNCNSFSYAVSTIHIAKAFADFDLDFNNTYIDTISTNTSAYFHKMSDVIQAFLQFFEKAISAYNSQAITNYSYHALIKLMDQKENELERKSTLTIAGEENNAFKPGKQFGEPTSQQTSQAGKYDTATLTKLLEKIIFSDQFDSSATFDLITKVRSYDPKVLPIILDKFIRAENLELPLNLIEVLLRFDNEELDQIVTAPYRDVLVKVLLNADEPDFRVAQLMTRFTNSDQSVQKFIKSVFLDPRSPDKLKLTLLEAFSSNTLTFHVDDILQYLAYTNSPETLNVYADKISEHLGYGAFKRLNTDLLKTLEKIAEATTLPAKLVALYTIAAEFYVQTNITKRIAKILISNKQHFGIILQLAMDNELIGRELYQLVSKDLESIYPNEPVDNKTLILDFFASVGHKSPPLINHVYADIAAMPNIERHYLDSILHYLFVSGIKHNELVNYILSRNLRVDFPNLARVGQVPTKKVKEKLGELDCDDDENLEFYALTRTDPAAKVKKCLDKDGGSFYAYLKVLTNHDDQAKSLEWLINNNKISEGDHISYSYTRTGKYLKLLKLMGKIP